MDFIDFRDDAKNTFDVYGIAEISKYFNVTPRALRFYEQKGLLSPRRNGLQRIYSSKDRARLQLILLGKRFGLSVAEIKQLLDLYEPDGTNRLQFTRAIEMGERQLSILKHEREAIDSSIKELEKTLSCLRDEISVARR
jgi:DNA-binding transcriptional MerR regulator